MLEMFRQVLQALADYICNFAIQHPRLVWVIVGTLCIYAIVCALISLLIGG